MRIKQFLLAALLLFGSPVWAINNIQFQVETLDAQNWQLAGVALTLSELDSTPIKFSLSAKKLTLPAPLDALQFFAIQCQSFIWQEKNIRCKQGYAQLKSRLFGKQAFRFTLQIKNKRAVFKLSHLKIFGGNIKLTLQEKRGYWTAKLQAKKINLQKIQKFLALKTIDSVSGKGTVSAQLSGSMSQLEQAILSALISELSIQDATGKLASEALTLHSELKLKKQGKKWQWQIEQSLSKGAVYVEPVYLEIQKKQPISLTAAGSLDTIHKKINLSSAQLNHQSIAHAKAQAVIFYQDSLMLQQANIQFYADNLAAISSIYIAPFLEGKPFQDIILQGSLSAILAIENQALHQAHLNFNNLHVASQQQNLSIEQLGGTLYWNRLWEDKQASNLHWQTLNIKDIPFAATQLDFSLAAQQLQLLKPARLGLLDGTLSIEKFHFKSNPDDESAVTLRARLEQLSLSKLSEALHWQNTLSGTLSGYIPSVSYQQKKLTLEGGLKMQLFDGEIRISQLAASGLLTDFSQFYIDLEFENLDLNEVTKKFPVGRIQGRLSGFAHNVYLENWQPIGFYAWLGTPEEDSSVHKISHRAVRNIASLGGSSAADVISRGVLSWFDDFGYDRLGIGCYLHQGVCQMTGASAAREGYYLIKGGGIPSIDIIGFNTRVNWTTLVNRLKRITANNMVVEP